MSGLRVIKRRIASVKNTRKITRAMKMVAAARLRRAQQRITQLRPYAAKIAWLIAQVAARVEDREMHPLLAERKEHKALIIVLTSDRGLAGGFNSSVSKRAHALWKELEAQGKEVTIGTIGRRGAEYFKRFNAKIDRSIPGIHDNVTSERAGNLGRFAAERFVSGECDSVYFVYNVFKSALVQTVTVEKFLPLTPAEINTQDQTDYIYEPSQAALLDRLLPMYMEVQSFRTLLDSLASEHGARMTAMENATDNATDMIDKLTLQYNRARQAAITKELMEIIGGAEALKG